MGQAVSYSISSTGGVVEGHEPDVVISEFSSIFGVHKDKAAAYIDKQKLIKKDLNEAQAYAYRDKFTQIGIPVTLEKHEVDMPDAFGGLSLAPANEAVATSPAGTQSAGPPAANKTSEFSCPKCDTDQPKSETCVSCGIIFEKYKSAKALRETGARKPASSGADRDAISSDADEHDNFSDEFEFSVASIGAAVAVAIIGALLWWFLAINVGVEYGFAAWIIGAAIGGAAAMFGTQSNVDGVICAVLLVLAIAGGKFMTAGSIASEYNGTTLLDSEDVAMILEDYSYDAQLFSQVGNDANSIRTFMAKNGYSYSEYANEIDDEELTEFELNTAPMLKELHDNPTGLENSAVLYSAMYGEEAPELMISKGDVFTALWGPFDLLFLLLGMASAFKLASGRQGN